MSSPTRIPTSPLLLPALAAALIVFALTWVRTASVPQAAGLDTSREFRPLAPSATPWLLQPMYSYDDARAASYAQLPLGFDPIDDVGRLIDYNTFEAWIDLDYPWASANDPVWLVGFLPLQQVTLNDVLAVFPDALSYEEADDIVEGAYYAWDANSSDLIAVGALDTTTNQDFASLTALTDAAATITVVPATVDVYLGTPGTPADPDDPDWPPTETPYPTEGSH